MKRVLSIGIAASLSACASHNPPPRISYDAAAFEEAVIEREPALPMKIVAVPEPLPLPGQLKAVPNKKLKEKSDSRPPMRRVDAANEAAKVEPSENGYINAIQVYPYTEGALYQLYAAPEQVSDIALQAGEELVSVSAGDTVRWVVGDTASGEGDTARTHILVKPIKEGLSSNLVIITDQRAYHVEMHSTEATYMASLSWTYPHDELISLRRENKRAKRKSLEIADLGLDLERLKFRYAISGDEPAWRPLRAFDDGNKVYIQFPARIGQGEAPPLFVVGPKGDIGLVNYRVRGAYYIVDRLFAAAELRLGEDPQEIVRITRTDGKADDGKRISSRKGPR